VTRAPATISHSISRSPSRARAGSILGLYLSTPEIPDKPDTE